MCYTDHVNQHKQCLFRWYARWSALINNHKYDNYSVYEHNFESPWLWGNSFTFKTMTEMDDMLVHNMQPDYSFLLITTVRHIS